MSLTSQINDATMAAAKDRLVAARVDAAYAARWQYAWRGATGTALPLKWTEYESSGFSYDIVGDSINIEAGDTALTFLVSFWEGDVTAGNGLRIKLNAEFEPDPLSPGQVLNFFVSTTEGVIYTGTITETGVSEYSFIADKTGHVEVYLAAGTYDGDPWNEGQTAQVTVLVESFPPSLPGIEYSLNPAIPFHTVSLAIPDESFGCLARVVFTNGGAQQGSEILVPLGPQKIFVATPPCRPLQNVFYVGTDSIPYSIKEQKVINNETGAVVSTYCALFEWTAVADKCSISFSHFQGNPGNIFSGILQMPRV